LLQGWRLVVEAAIGDGARRAPLPAGTSGLGAVTK
jgi:hypothetical protein